MGSATNLIHTGVEVEVRQDGQLGGQSLRDLGQSLVIGFHLADGELEIRIQVHSSWDLIIYSICRIKDDAIIEPGSSNTPK